MEGKQRIKINNYEQQPANDSKFLNYQMMVTADGKYNCCWLAVVMIPKEKKLVPARPKRIPVSRSHY